MHFAYTTILNAPRFGWGSAPDRPTRLHLYRQVRRMGFDGIEWSPRWLDYHHLSAEAIRSLRREADDCGLVVSAINLNRFLLTGCAESEEHFSRLLRTIDVASNLGAESVVISLSYPRPPALNRQRIIGRSIGAEDFQRTAHRIRLAADRADQVGVRLVLELHDDGLLDTPELCLRMQADVDRGNVWINPDLGNLVRHPESCHCWGDALHQLAPVCGYWHVKNYSAGRPVPIWAGDIDYAEAFEVMCATGYQGWISIESYFGDDVMVLQQQSLEWLRQLEAMTAV